MQKLERIVIVGGSCSGKTTLAKRLSEFLQIPHIELDALHWGSGWKENPREQFRAELLKAISQPRWICDGNYTFVRELIWPQATDLLWLNYSFPLVFQRAMRRTIGRALRKTPIFSGNRETFSRSFLSRDSILLWVIQSHGQRRKQIEQLLEQEEYSHLNVRIFQKPVDSERFVKQVGC